jgi:hypothetical protein
MKPCTMNMKINIQLLLVLLLLCSNIPQLSAQNTFDEKENEKIAYNIEKMMQRFASSLEFDIELDEKTINAVDQKLQTLNDSLPTEILDSIKWVHLDSLREIQRNEYRQNFLGNFAMTKKTYSGSISGFAFDSLIHPESFMDVSNFSQLYFGLYDQVNGLLNLNYKFRNKLQPNLRPVVKAADIRKSGGKYLVDIPFSLGWIEGDYDTTSRVFKQFPFEIQKHILETESFSTTKKSNIIELSMQVQFDDPDDATSFRIHSVSLMDVTLSYPELFSFLKDGIVKNLETNMPLDPARQTIDTVIIPDLIKLFEDPDKQSLQCSLFFEDQICNTLTNDTSGEANISIKQYCLAVQNNYSSIGYFDIDLLPGEIKVRESNGYDIVKIPAQTRFIPFPKEEFGSKGIRLDHTQPTNFYFKVDYKMKLFPVKKDHKSYTNAKVTDIAGYDKKQIEISQPVKKGSYSLSANYSPFYHQFIIDENKCFRDLSVEFKASHAIGLEGAYYWFSKRENQMLGISVGIQYEMITAGIYADSLYYANLSTGNQNPTGDEVVSYEERVWVSDFSQNIKYNQLSIPVMFNFMKIMPTKTIFNLGLGAKVAFIGSDQVEITQSDGHFTRTGYYQVAFPGGENGSYILENIPEYQYYTDYSIDGVAESEESEVNSPSISIQLNPSFAIPVSENNPNLYLNLGLTFQYGLTPLYDQQDAPSLLTNTKSNSGFMYGIEGQNFAIGLTVGIRYFNATSKRATKQFVF